MQNCLEEKKKILDFNLYFNQNSIQYRLDNHHFNPILTEKAKKKLLQSYLDRKS